MRRKPRDIKVEGLHGPLQNLFQSSLYGCAEFLLPSWKSKHIYTYIYMLNVNLKISDLKVIKKQTIEGKQLFIKGLKSKILTKLLYINKKKTKNAIEKWKSLAIRHATKEVI